MDKYIVNGKECEPTEFENKSFIDFTIENRPSKLFKYFRNDTTTDNLGNKRNYSIESLLTNSVHLESPINFDDSNLCLNFNDFKLTLIKYYLRTLNILDNHCKTYEQCIYKLVEFIVKNSGAPYDANKIRQILSPLYTKKESFLDDGTFIIRTNKNKLFIQEIINYVNHSADKCLIRSITSAILSEYNSAKKFTQENFKVSCFTTSPYSILMWSHYANNHKGFCVEYDLSDTSVDNKIHCFILPVFYSNSRKNIINFCLSDILPNEQGDSMREAIFKYGLLSKSDIWKNQSEWRLISYLNYITDKEYNCQFYKIRKVYLGCKMDYENRAKIISICKEKNINFSCMQMKETNYELVECNC